MLHHSIVTCFYCILPFFHASFHLFYFRFLSLLSLLSLFLFFSFSAEQQVLSTVLSETFADTICLYAALKQNTVRYTGNDNNESGNGRDRGSGRSVGFEGSEKNNFRTNNKLYHTKVEFLHFFYISLYTSPPSEDKHKATLRSLEKILITIINFKNKNFPRESPLSNIFPLPEQMWNLMSKKVQGLLREKQHM